MFYSENEFVQVCGGLGGVFFSLFENNQFHFEAFLQRIHGDGLVIVSIPLVPSGRTEVGHLTKRAILPYVSLVFESTK